jgi:hypothetical protein
MKPCNFFRQANEAMELLLSSSVSRHIRVLFSYFSWRFLDADERYYVVEGFQGGLRPLFHLDPGRLFGTLHTDVHSSFAHSFFGLWMAMLSGPFL